MLSSALKVSANSSFTATHLQFAAMNVTGSEHLPEAQRAEPPNRVARLIRGSYSLLVQGIDLGELAYSAVVPVSDGQ